MTDRRILNLVNRFYRASVAYKTAKATYRATHDLRWQAAVSEAAREEEAAKRALLEAEGERQAQLGRGGVA